MSGCAGSQKKTMQQEKENTTMVADIANTGSGNYYGTYWAYYPELITVTLKINSDTTDELRSEYWERRTVSLEKMAFITS